MLQIDLKKKRKEEKTGAEEKFVTEVLFYTFNEKKPPGGLGSPWKTFVQLSEYLYKLAVHQIVNKNHCSTTWDHKRESILKLELCYVFSLWEKNNARAVK